MSVCRPLPFRVTRVLTECHAVFWSWIMKNCLILTPRLLFLNLIHGVVKFWALNPFIQLYNETSFVKVFQPTICAVYFSYCWSKICMFDNMLLVVCGNLTLTKLVISINVKERLWTCGKLSKYEFNCMSISESVMWLRFL